MTLYSPFWLHDLPKEQREEVIQWLVDHGINPELARSFEYSPKGLVTVQIYALQNGKPHYDQETYEPVMDKDWVFAPKYLPRALTDIAD